MAAMRLLLTALQHPQAESVQLDAFRSLVFWLEDRKIRLLPVNGRKALASADSPDWPAACDKYLGEAGCPAPILAAESDAQLLWLLRLAVAREYEDNKSKLRAATAAQTGLPPAAEVQRRKPKAHLDVSPPEVRDQLVTLLQRVASAFGTQADTSSLALALQDAQAALTHRILPALAAKQQGVGSTEAAEFPLGFSTGDKQLDFAAKLLRILYTQELRKLQSLIDGIIVDVQELTSNPKTDSALGRTGR